MLGTIDRDVIYRLLEALSQTDATRLMNEVETVDAFAPEYETLLADIISVLQRIAIAQALPDAIDDSQGDREVILALAGGMSPEDVQLYYQIALLGRRDLYLSPEPRGGFEMVMLRMLAFRPGANTQNEVPVTSTKQVASTPVSKPATANAKTPIPSAKLNPAPVPAEGGEWAAIIGALPLKGMVREMSLNCVYHGLDGEHVKLSLDPAHAHLLGKARVQQLESALCEYYQHTVRVTIDKGGKLEKETPARKQIREQDLRQQRAEQAIAQDENIRAMQDTFGATVSRESIRPRE